MRWPDWAGREALGVPRPIERQLHGISRSPVGANHGRSHSPAAGRPKRTPPDRDRVRRVTIAPNPADAPPSGQRQLTDLLTDGWQPVIARPAGASA